MNRGSLPLMWSVGLGVSVPLWAGSRQKPAIAEADSVLLAASAADQSMRRQLEARTVERLARMEQLAAESELDSGLLVQDRLSVEAALASYRTGSVPFVTVLEALGTTFVDRRAAVSRRASLLRAEADLRELSLDGGPSPSLSTPPTSGTAGSKM